MTDIPSSFNHIQLEGVSFRSPVSEGTLQAIGGTINGTVIELFAFEASQTVNNAAQQATLNNHEGRITFLENNVPPVGSILDSMLTEVQFQAQWNVGWILADGRSVVGSRYHTLTGHTVAPDLRGMFLRGKDNGRGLNPDGELALGTETPDQMLAHTHTMPLSGAHTHRLLIRGRGATGGAAGSNLTVVDHGPGVSGEESGYGTAANPINGESVWFAPSGSDTRFYSAFSPTGSVYWVQANDLDRHTHPVDNFGGNETKPINVIINHFFRIN